MALWNEQGKWMVGERFVFWFVASSNHHHCSTFQNTIVFKLVVLVMWIIDCSMVFSMSNHWECSWSDSLAITRNPLIELNEQWLHISYSSTFGWYRRWFLWFNAVIASIALFGEWRVCTLLKHRQSDRKCVSFHLSEFLSEIACLLSHRKRY